MENIKKEFPHIQPFSGDLDWQNQAFSFLEEQDYDEAEVLFKKICLSETNHHDGFEGLAYVYYVKGEFEKAEWFMQEALKRASKFLDDDTIDPEEIEEMKNSFQRLMDRKPLKTIYGTFKPSAGRVLFAENEEKWYEQYYNTSFKLRYQMLMETLEHPLPFEVLDKTEVDFKEELEEQQRLQELYSNYVQILLEKREMNELRLLLEKFRASQPELYREDYHYYDKYLIQIALFHGEKEKVSDYLNNFIEY
ncbi:MAG: hypothetical protein Q7J85_13905, partial [Bacillota bacterium]|nr:hypothetical protein [Bacillota bacterium]